jgi:uncharacterized protein YqjF (DUF2071 family)
MALHKTARHEGVIMVPEILAPKSICAPSPARTTRPGPWLWSQDWLDLLFAHWPVPVAALRPHIPASLDIETFDGTAWASLVAFRLERIRRRGLTSLGVLTNSLELNFRTYVRHHGESGIYFLSIHASNPLLVGLARLATSLPYQSAQMTYDRQESTLRFASHRPMAERMDRSFALNFRPMDRASRTEPASLDHWLVERYCLFVEGRGGRLLRTLVEHPPWEVQSGQAQVTANTMAKPFALDISETPALVHFSPGVRAQVWPFVDVTSQGSRGLSPSSLTRH